MKSGYHSGDWETFAREGSGYGVEVAFKLFFGLDDFRSSQSVGMFEKVGLHHTELCDAEYVAYLDAAFDRLQMPLVFRMVTVVAIIHPGFCARRIAPLRVTILVLGGEEGFQSPLFEPRTVCWHVLKWREIVKQHGVGRRRSRNQSSGFCSVLECWSFMSAAFFLVFWHSLRLGAFSSQPLYEWGRSSCLLQIGQCMKADYDKSDNAPYLFARCSVLAEPKELRYDGKTFEYIEVSLAKDDAVLIEEFKERALQLSQVVRPEDPGGWRRDDYTKYCRCLVGVVAEAAFRHCVIQFASSKDVKFHHQKFNTSFEQIDVGLIVNGNPVEVEVRSSCSYKTSFPHIYRSLLNNWLVSYIHQTRRESEGVLCPDCFPVRRLGN